MLGKVIHQLCTKTPIINAVRYNTTNGTKLEKTINQVTLLGRVGIDPQKRGSFEHPVVIFTLATHYNYRYENGEVTQKTEWHKISVFKPNLRERIQTYLTKGQRVLVQGRITYGEYKDDDQNIRTATTIVADDVVFFQSKNDPPREE